MGVRFQMLYTFLDLAIFLYYVVRIKFYISYSGLHKTILNITMRDRESFKRIY